MPRGGKARFVAHGGGPRVVPRSRQSGGMPRRGTGAMSLDPAFLLPLAFKMVVTGGFVVLASLAAERGGPLIGAMVATLPISAGPAYVFLALDHPPAFIAESGLSSLITNVATALFSLAYAALAQRNGPVPSIGGALAAWFAVLFAAGFVEWTLLRGILLTLVVFPPCLFLASRFRHAALRAPARRWFDLPLRAGLVSVLVVVVVAASPHVGPALTGILALFPIVLTSLMMILHPRVGGRATAAVIANAISGLLGFGVALTALTVTAVPFGSAAALALALAISVGWNVMVFFARRRGIPI